MLEIKRAKKTKKQTQVYSVRAFNLHTAYK
jgi:hypothetical protein